MESWNTEIERTLRDNGAGLVGFANVSELPQAMTGGLPRAISIGVPLDPAIVREIAGGADSALLRRVQSDQRPADAVKRSGGRHADPHRPTSESRSRDNRSLQSRDIVDAGPAQDGRHAGRAGVDRQIRPARDKGIRPRRATGLRPDRRRRRDRRPCERLALRHVSQLRRPLSRPGHRRGQLATEHVARGRSTTHRPAG